jgi:hypothetical protein
MLTARNRDDEISHFGYYVLMPFFPQLRPFTWCWNRAISNTFLAASLVFGNHCEHQSRFAILHDRVQLFWTWSSIFVCQHKWSISYRFGPAPYFRRPMIYCSSLLNMLFSCRKTFTSRCFYGDKGRSKNMQIGLSAIHWICSKNQLIDSLTVLLWFLTETKYL